MTFLKKSKSVNCPKKLEWAGLHYFWKKFPTVQVASCAGYFLNCWGFFGAWIHSPYIFFFQSNVDMFILFWQYFFRKEKKNEKKAKKIILMKMKRRYKRLPRRLRKRARVDSLNPCIRPLVRSLVLKVRE